MQNKLKDCAQAWETLVLPNSQFTLPRFFNIVYIFPNCSVNPYRHWVANIVYKKSLLTSMLSFLYPVAGKLL